MVIRRVLKKFRIILSRHQKLRVVELAVIMVISGFWRRLILPFMSAVMDPEELMRHLCFLKIGFMQNSATNAELINDGR